MRRKTLGRLLGNEVGEVKGMKMADCELVSSSVIPFNCVILCISRAGLDGGKSRIYAAKVDQDGSLSSIGSGNPFHLANKEKGCLWKNVFIRKASLRVGDIAKYHIEENQCVYDEKIGSRMVS